MTNPVTTPTTIMPKDALIVKLAAKPDFSGVLRMPRGPERKAAAWERIVASSQKSQAPFVEIAEQLVASHAIASYEVLMSPNVLIIDPNAAKSAEVLQQFGTAKGVHAVYGVDGYARYVDGVKQPFDGDVNQFWGESPNYGLDVYSRGAVVDAQGLGAEDTPYGITMVGAKEANAEGADGTGLVYGSIDTGADVTHEAIAGKYRGRNADGSVSNDYNWFDFGDQRSAQPKDYDAHGTHTIGTVLGSTDTLQIGVAPKAKWISVPAIREKTNIDVRLKALQFMQAPTKLDGTAPDPTKAPDVVGMSWWDGPKQSDIFKESMENLIAAGIEPVKSAGNNGNGPETISAPGQFQNINAVAAVDSTGQIAEFSSRGPSPLPHGNLPPVWKPDFAAPGVDVLSSVPGNMYQTMSGTSMAQPHFAGALLDLISKFPHLDHSKLVEVLKQSSVDAGARGRDLEFGWGIINLPAALKAATQWKP